MAVAPNFFYPPDPSSQIVCSIGGNVAENSGGAHCFKYGFTTNYVTGLEVVLADGEVVHLGGAELDQPGYDLLGAFVGAEGTLGIATKVWLRVVPVPEAIANAVAFFDSTRQAGEAVSEIVQCRRRARRDRDDGRADYRRHRTDGACRISGGAGAALLVELDGSEHECIAQFDDVVAICVGGAGPTTCASAGTRRSGSCSGRCARPRSPPWVAWRRTTSCRTA